MALLRTALVLYCTPAEAPSGAAAGRAHLAAVYPRSPLRSLVLNMLWAACSALAWLEVQQRFLKQLCLCAWFADALRLDASIESALLAAVVGCVTLTGGLESFLLAPAPEFMQQWTGMGTDGAGCGDAHARPVSLRAMEQTNCLFCSCRPGHARLPGSPGCSAGHNGRTCASMGPPGVRSLHLWQLGAA